MDKKLKYRNSIEFGVKLGWDLKTTKENIKKAYGEDAPSNSTISEWWYFFRRGGESVEDAPRSGRPLQPVNSRFIKAITNLIAEDDRISLSTIAMMTGESKSYVEKTIKSRTNIIRVEARWVPKVLNLKQKEARVKSCRMILNEYNDNWDDLLDNLVTVDETWIYFEPNETKKSAGRWQTPDRELPEVGRIKKDPRKVMATVFWNKSGILFIDYLKTGKSINSEYYCNLLDQVYKKIPRNRRKKVIFLQDNCPAHRSKLATNKIESLGWKILDHPAYSPDLSPSDYYLFRNLKSELFNRKFISFEEVETEVNEYFTQKPSDWFFRGFEMYNERLNDCIKNKGDY